MKKCNFSVFKNGIAQRMSERERAGKNETKIEREEHQKYYNMHIKQHVLCVADKYFSI